MLTGSGLISFVVFVGLVFVGWRLMLGGIGVFRCVVVW